MCLKQTQGKRGEKVNELVIVRKEETVTTSLKVAETFHKRHDSVMRDIRNMECSKEFTAHNFVESRYKDKTGKYNPMFYITKDGFMFLAMGYRGKKAAKFKEAYIMEFNRMHDLLTELASQGRIEAREQAKINRRLETDTIQEFVTYAVLQGSKNADKYYKNFTTLANNVCGVEDRNVASAMQLHNLIIVENLIKKLIEQGMGNGDYYKDIYKACKVRCWQLNQIAMIGG